MRGFVDNADIGPCFPAVMPELEDEGEASIPFARMFPDDEAGGDEHPVEAFLDGLLVAVLAPVVSLVVWLFFLALLLFFVGVTYKIVVFLYDWLF